MSQRAAAGRDEKRIDMAVVAAFELDNLIATGEPARESDARHGGVGAAVHHAHLLDGWHPTADQFCHLHFERSWNAKANAASGGFSDCGDHYFRRVAKDRWAPCSNEVDVFSAIDVPDLRARGAVDKERFAIQPAKRADGRIDAAGDALLRQSEQ